MGPANVTTQVTLTTGFQSVTAVNPFGFLVISRIHICNTSSSSVTVQVCFVPQGQSPSQSNAALWNFSIAGNDFLEWGKDEFLPAGTVIWALASSSNAVNLFLSAIGK